MLRGCGAVSGGERSQNQVVSMTARTRAHTHTLTHTHTHTLSLSLSHLSELSRVLELKQRLLLLRCHKRWNAALQNAALLVRDLRERVAEDGRVLIPCPGSGCGDIVRGERE